MRKSMLLIFFSTLFCFEVFSKTCYLNCSLRVKSFQEDRSLNRLIEEKKNLVVDDDQNISFSPIYLENRVFLFEMWTDDLRGGFEVKLNNGFQTYTLFSSVLNQRTLIGEKILNQEKCDNPEAIVFVDQLIEVALNGDSLKGVLSCQLADK